MRIFLKQKGFINKIANWRVYPHVQTGLDFFFIIRIIRLFIFSSFNVNLDYS